MTQADIDAGSITNTAVATADDPDDDPVTSPSDDATVTVDQAPALTLLKTATPSTVDSVRRDGVTYSFAVTNTGNATLTGVRATDTSFSGTGTPPVITCPVTTLAPGESTTCTGDATR